MIAFLKSPVNLKFAIFPMLTLLANTHLKPTVYCTQLKQGLQKIPSSDPHSRVCNHDFLLPTNQNLPGKLSLPDDRHFVFRYLDLLSSMRHPQAQREEEPGSFPLCSQPCLPWHRAHSEALGFLLLL